MLLFSDNQHNEATCACIPKEDALEIHSSDLSALKSSFTLLCQCQEV
jgi:hypothetical protein